MEQKTEQGTGDIYAYPIPGVIHVRGEEGVQLMERLKEKRGTFDPKKASRDAHRQLREEMRKARRNR